MADQTAISTPTSPRRPWYRLHFSTWVVLLLGAIVATLLVVPGELSWYPSEHSLIAERPVVHGWPLAYLRRGGHEASLQGDTAAWPWEVSDSSNNFNSSR